MTIIHFIVPPQGDPVVDHFAQRCAERGKPFYYSQIVGQEKPRKRKPVNAKVLIYGYVGRPMGYVERIIDSLH